MTGPLDNQSTREGYLDLTHAIARRLELDGWKVLVEPRVNGYVPDLLAEDPSGATFVVEVKAHEDTVHFAGLGQAAAYRQGLAAQSAPQAVVVSTGQASDELQSLARELAVELVTVPSSDVDGAASQAVSRLNDLMATQRS